MGLRDCRRSTWPQELHLHGITTYVQANRYLREVFVPDFQPQLHRGVAPALPESAFSPIAGVDLELLLSAKQGRVCAIGRKFKPEFSRFFN
jgi:hypothetical protein